MHHQRSENIIRLDTSYLTALIKLDTKPRADNTGGSVNADLIAWPESYTADLSRRIKVNALRSYMQDLACDIKVIVRSILHLLLNAPVCGGLPVQGEYSFRAAVFVKGNELCLKYTCRKRKISRFLKVDTSYGTGIII